MIATDFAWAHFVRRVGRHRRDLRRHRLEREPEPRGGVSRRQSDRDDAGGEVEGQRLRTDAGVVRAHDAVEALGDGGGRGRLPGRGVGGVVDRHDLDLPPEEAAARVDLAGRELRAVEHADADALLVAGERRLEADPDVPARGHARRTDARGQGRAEHAQPRPVPQHPSSTSCRPVRRGPVVGRRPAASCEPDSVGRYEACDRPRRLTPVEVTFWGTRGSIAKAGPTTVRYGGNTSCVSVRTDAGTLLVLDCGTGIHELGQALVPRGRPVDGHLLIGHTHWDHIQGLPFFAPLFDDRQRVARLRAARPRHVDRRHAGRADAVHVLPRPAPRLRRDDRVPRPRRGPVPDRRRHASPRATSTTRR